MSGIIGFSITPVLHKVVDDARYPKPPLGANQCHVLWAWIFTNERVSFSLTYSELILVFKIIVKFFFQQIGHFIIPFIVRS